MDELYVLPFDHRGSFMKIVGASSPPTDEDVNKAREYKQLIYKAFKKSVSEGVPQENAGILVDGWLGKEILTDSKEQGFIRCTPLEKSGQEEFAFDREDWKQQIEDVDPTYVKVLVRYNPEGDKELNCRQNGRLKELSEYLSGRKNKLMFELLVGATEEQLASAGSKDVYDREIRPGLMVAAIKEIQDSGVNPDLWKLEGLESSEDMQKVADQVTAGNPDSRIIILGRGESAEKAEHWLKTGAKVDAAIGFAVGRTIFKEPLEELASGKIGMDDAVKRISENYSFFVDVWKKAKSS